jgi:dihydroorotate dehydrogenase electron transfer subunit
MAGASLYGIGSAVYQKGLSIFREIDGSMRGYLHRNGFQDTAEIIGLSHRSTTYSFYETDWNVPQPGNVHLKSRFTVAPVHAVERNENRLVQTVFFEANRLFADDEDSADQLNLFERLDEGAAAGVQRPSQKPKPGQFYMLWLPGVTQKPYSVSYFDGELVGFTCKRRGCFSDRMFDLEPGEPVGLLGPLGRGFDLSRDNYLLIGGGIGSAPLVFAALELIRRGRTATLFFGAECRDYLDWIEPLFTRMGGSRELDIHYCTEDGSLGMSGMITDHLDGILERRDPGYTLLCGPEMFVKNSIPLLREKGLDGQASIERMMKCGIGICGSCSVDHTGDRVCVEGPVFDVDYLQQMKEFGSYFLDESGAVINDTRQKTPRSSS